MNYSMDQSKDGVRNDTLDPTKSTGWSQHTSFASGGIQMLRTINSLLVKHRPSLSEALLGFAARAKYDIFNDQNEQILSAYEESGCCQRYWCAAARHFVLHVVDNSKQEIIRIHREFSCCAGCCWFSYCKSCQQEVIIESPPGNPIGTITQGGSCWRMNYILKDISESITLNIQGPGCICDGPMSCCCENKFTLFGTDGITEIGAIHKKYAGYCSEAFTSADKFSYEVPMDLDVNMKAIVLGALFTIDFSNFAMVPKQNN